MFIFFVSNKIQHYKELGFNIHHRVGVGIEVEVGVEVGVGVGVGIELRLGLETWS